MTESSISGVAGLIFCSQVEIIKAIDTCLFYVFAVWTYDMV